MPTTYTGPAPQRILVIQTAFLGDVVLALPVMQALRNSYPNTQLTMLVRAGNQALLANHPAIDQVWVWEKQKGKYRSWLALLGKIRAAKFDLVINLHRFGSSGLLTVLSGAGHTRGFAKNPFSLGFSQRFPHRISPNGTLHEVDRNLSLLDGLLQAPPERRPQLYPSPADYAAVADYRAGAPYVVVAPASVWFTKQWPASKWRELLQALPPHLHVYLIGAPSEAPLCAEIATAHSQAVVLAGQLTLLQAAALMDGAQRVFCNDSGPLHIASAMNAPTTAVFCSTVPGFGFGPLANDATVWQVPTPLACRPCGLHGHKACPQGHFACAINLPVPASPL